MEDFTEKINSIKESILKNTPVKYIYLFGSYAYGKPTDKSDKEEDVIYALNAVERIRNIEPIQNSRNFLIRENKTQDDVKETAINNDVLPNCA